MKKAVSSELRTLLLLCFFFFLCESSRAVIHPEYKFQYLTAHEGLPQNTVDCILRDKRGFMWFGTWNGLCRYDGYAFKTYRKGSNSEGLPDNFVQTLCEDEKGNIWVGTGEGLSCFDFDERNFFIPPHIDSVFTRFSVNHLALDSQNRLWVATESHGLWIISPGRNEPIIRKINDSHLPDRHTNYICFFKELALIGTDRGLAIVGKSNLQVARVFPDLVRSVQDLNINCVFADSKNNIWVGSDAGLFEYDSSASRVYHYSRVSGNPETLNHLSVTDIAEDCQGNLIIGTLGGLNYFNPEGHSFSHLNGGSEETKNLNNPFVNSLYVDKQGNVWIGTEKGGVNYYNVFQKPFHSLVHNPADKNSLSHNTINSVLKERDVLWVGTAGGGLNRITDQGKQVDHFKLDAGNPQSLRGDFISTIFRDSNKHLWVGTWGWGLCLLKSLKGHTFDAFQHRDVDPGSICSDFVSSVYELDEHRLLVGTRGGLDLFLPDSRTFIHVHDKMKLNEPLEVGCLLKDLKERLWIGTKNGLYRINTGQLDHLETTDKIDYAAFFNIPHDSLSISGNYVISLLEDRQGRIWIGTYGRGICRYEEDPYGRTSFINYTERDGLCNNVAYSMEEDLQENLWISTDKGLSKFNPDTKVFQNFYVKDGLLSDQFYWTASDADREGNLYFGGIGGLNYFKAADIDLYQKTKKPVFTEFSVFNNPVKIGQKYHSKVILQKSVSETSELVLSWRDAVFSIEFSALDYFLPEKIKYRYRMEGVDQDWVIVPAGRRFANYTHLSGGKYVFQVKASNSDGVWSDDVAELKITVQPPFWKTIWFRMIFVLFLFSLVMAYIHSRTRFLKQQKRKLEQQVKERTEKVEEQKEKLRLQADHLQTTNQQLAERQQLIEGQKVELEAQNTKIARQRDELIVLNEKVNLVNQLRLRFFTNISHEFKTPLTLIIDPLEHLMKNLKADQNTVNTLKIINRNAQRLLHLINQLIYFRRIESGKMKLRVCRGDLKQFLYQIFESFQDLAMHQTIAYSFDAAGTPDETWFDAEKLENILYNLLSNAFKYTPSGGKIFLKLKFVDKDEQNDFSVPYVLIEVTDTGKGIAAKHLPFIFERFYQADSGNNTGMKSSGIGLTLTYELVEALHGKIRVESDEGKGSCFYVLLPYTKDRFAGQELDQTTLPPEVNLEGRVDMLIQNLVYAESDFEDEDSHGKTKSNPLVLIVEDNFDLRTFLVKTLKSDYRVLGAENGKDGFSMAKKYSPDIIISDVMMPVMDGIELCSRLKKEIQTSHIPVILLTAKNMMEDWIEGLETGADDYIPKPFNLQVLQVRMANLIDGRRRLKKMFSNPQDALLDELTSNPIDEEFMLKVYAILEKSYQNPEFSASRFASEMFVSRSLLYKKIKAITDLNITDFINSFKLKKAVELIQENKLPITDIAFNVGFNDPKYFSRIFRKFYGMSPSEFQSKK